mgnify:CR=1 FL=1
MILGSTFGEIKLLDQIEKFLKNKYTIFSLIGVVILIIALNVYSYFKTEKNEAEFLRFVEINDAFASDIESATVSYTHLTLPTNC